MRTSRLLLGGLLLAALALAGCAAKGPALTRALESRVDDRSAARLPQGEDQGALVVAVVHGREPAPDLSAELARPLAFVPGVALLEVVPEASDVLKRLPDHQQVVVWGPASAVARMAPSLREVLARRLADGRWQDADVNALATFRDTDADLVSQLATSGARMGSCRDGVCTLTAAPEFLLDLLARSDLSALEAPTTLQPASGR
ncbi:MAG TPA: hypothetical protein P5571_13300 [Candidatus Krumholzibacteria bacterium]|nr:hypothetical protein [Candidatus Krumholzibacteria bacterium]HRX52339.1 hypothetical protein [Candidatus Krumholzibacteria bacterium]